MAKQVKPSKIMEGSKFYVVEDLMKILSLSKLTIRGYLRKGKIKCFKLGRRYYVAEKNLKAFLGGGRFFDQPDDVITDKINQAIKLTFESNVKWLAYHVKELIIDDLKENINQNLKKIDENNKQLAENKNVPKEAVEHFRYRTEKVKKDLQKV